jgi:hypothetical protein
MAADHRQGRSTSGRFLEGPQPSVEFCPPDQKGAVRKPETKRALARRAGRRTWTARRPTRRMPRHSTSAPAPPGHLGEARARGLQALSGSVIGVGVLVVTCENNWLISFRRGYWPSRPSDASGRNKRGRAGPAGSAGASAHAVDWSFVATTLSRMRRGHGGASSREVPRGGRRHAGVRKVRDSLPARSDFGAVARLLASPLISCRGAGCAARGMSLATSCGGC